MVGEYGRRIQNAVFTSQELLTKVRPSDENVENNNDKIFHQQKPPIYNRSICILGTHTYLCPFPNKP